MYCCWHYLIRARLYSWTGISHETLNLGQTTERKKERRKKKTGEEEERSDFSRKNPSDICYMYNGAVSGDMFYMYNGRVCSGPFFARPFKFSRQKNNPSILL